jgi:chromosome segregation ATPase
LPSWEHLQQLEQEVLDKTSAVLELAETLSNVKTALKDAEDRIKSLDAKVLSDTAELTEVREKLAEHESALETEREVRIKAEDELVVLHQQVADLTVTVDRKQHDLDAAAVERQTLSQAIVDLKERLIQEAVRKATHQHDGYTSI